MIIRSSDTDFYPVEQLCSQTKKFISSLPQDKRYLKDAKWWVHWSVILDLIKRAKATGVHDTIDYTELPLARVAQLDRVLSGKKRMPVPASRKSDAYSVLYLLPGAPKQLVEAAFKALARMHHPDVEGGDHETFLAIKKAYDSIIS